VTGAAAFAGVSAFDAASGALLAVELLAALLLVAAADRLLSPAVLGAATSDDVVVVKASKNATAVRFSFHPDFACIDLS
jgi:hypothetical protein